MASSSSTAADAVNNEDELLLARLASQFGDIDLTNLLVSDNNQNDDGNNGDNNNANTDNANNDNNDEGEENNREFNVREEEESDDDDDHEPTAEEIQAWQAAQFKAGKEKLQEQKYNKLTALQRRLHDKRKRQRKRNQKKSSNDNSDDECWEKILQPPDLNGQESIFFPSTDDDGHEFLGGVHPLLLQLAKDGDPEVLGSKWLRLYSSMDGDGLSFHNLLMTLKGYEGPTIIFIDAVPSSKHSLNTKTTTENNNKKIKKNCTIGFYTTTPWIESTKYFGSSDCFLFNILNDQNKVNIIRPVSTKSRSRNENDDDDSSIEDYDNGKHYMFCYPSSLKHANNSKRSITTSSSTLSSRNSLLHKSTPMTDGIAHGIGIGGTSSQPRLHITENFESCRALAYDKLFEPGSILQPTSVYEEECLYYFDIDCIEVWGVGGIEWVDEALKEQKKYHDRVESNLLKVRTIKDKTAFLDDFKSGIYSSNANKTSGGGGLFQHVGQVQGRETVCTLDDE